MVVGLALGLELGLGLEMEVRIDFESGVGLEGLEGGLEQGRELEQGMHIHDASCWEVVGRGLR